MDNYSFAYQPIVDVSRRRCVGLEALVRGPAGESAGQVLAAFGKTPESLVEFDTNARSRAIALAARIGLQSDVFLSLNLLPESLTAKGDEPLLATMAAIKKAGLHPRQVMIEVSESQRITDFAQFYAITNVFKAQGLRFSVDDFGAGYAGLNMLAEFQPELIKLDMGLLDRVWERGPRQAIIRGIIRTCEDLGIDVVAEGVESVEQYRWLLDENVVMFQGYLFARPQFQAFPGVTYPA